MYERALKGYEKALGREHTSTLSTGKLAEAEEMNERALKGREKALGREHTSTLSTVNNLGLLYADQGKLAEAEEMYERALKGYEKALCTDKVITYIPALNTFRNLGALFERQADVGNARMMYSKALKGFEAAVGVNDSRSCNVRDKLRVLDNATEDESLVDMRDAANKHQKGGSRTAIESPSISRRHKLFTKLGFR
ncbi:hypothetical protein DL98DRAFT_522282 [Cadophora sp. DSE1049]|nr:hypothetical protein DL98DRAFT_522282 [Cadophora sp. DSE1049]